MTDSHTPIVVIGLVEAQGFDGQLFGETCACARRCAFVLVGLPDDRIAPLSAMSAMPVRRYRSGIRPVVGTLIVVPPAAQVTYDGVRVAALDATDAPLDRLLASVAAHCAGPTAGVLIGPEAGDGLHGLEAIGAAGGLTIHEPSTVGLAACAIARRLLQSSPDRSDSAVTQLIVKRLGQITGADFRNYRAPVLQRAIQRRMEALALPALGAYGMLIQERDQEVVALAESVLTHVTSFFRDPKTFDILERELAAEIVDGATEEGLRIWSVGCSSGQEAYSLAMLFSEVAETRRPGLPVIVFASDLRSDLLDRAVEGRYPASEADALPARYQAQWVQRESETIRINEALRRRVVFVQHDMLRDPSFLRMDLVACRNVLIYLCTSARLAAVSMFQLALRPSGVLLLGRDESVGDLGPNLSPAARGWPLYRKVADELSSEWGESDRRAMAEPIRRPRSGMRVRNRSGGLAHAALAAMADATLVVSPDGRLLGAYGKVDRYLMLGPGRPTAQVLDLAVPSLRTPLGTALHAAGQCSAPVTYRGIEIRHTSGTRTRTCLRVSSVKVPGFDAKCWLVSLDVLGELNAEATRAPLQTQLDDTRAQLEAVLEELDSSGIELATHNDDLRAANEEYQSANEELQSVNGALRTANGERQRQIQELTHLQSILNHLLNHTQTGLLFFTADLHLQRSLGKLAPYLPATTAEVGLPISQLAHGLLLGARSLETLCRQTIDTRAAQQLTVQCAHGETVHVHILPELDDSGAVSTVTVALVNVTQLRQAQTNAEMAHERLATVARLSRDVHFVAEGQTTYLSHAFEPLTGYPVDETGHPTRDLLALIHPPDRPRVTEQLRGWRSQIELEFRISRADGDLRWVRLRGDCVTDTVGRTQHIGVVKDISRQHREEASLRDLIAAIPDALLVVDEHQRIERINDQTERLFGYSADALIGQPLEILVPEPNRAAHPEHMRAYVARPQRRLMDQQGRRLLGRHRSGRLIPLDISLGPVRTDDGLRVIAVARDLTATDRLRSQLDRFRAALAQTSECLLLVNPTSLVIEDANRDLPGQRGDAPVGRTLAEAFPGRLGVRLAAAVQAHRLGAPEATLTGELADTEDPPRTLRVRVTRVALQDDPVAVVAVRDITREAAIERRLSDKQRELEQQQRLDSLGALAGGIAHEFNNLLQTIHAFTAFAVEGLPPGSAARDDLAQVTLSAERAATLTSQLLSFGRRGAMDVCALAPNTELRALAKMAAPLLGASIELRLELDKAAGRVEADPTQLHQVLLNLCLNARDAMPDGGRLTLSTHAAGLDGLMRVTVCDTGTGIAPATQAHIFEPFFTTKADGAGTGLGLSVAYGIVEQHGGRLELTRSDHAGTCFSILLPVVQPEPASGGAREDVATGAADTPTPVRATTTVLVADDEPPVLAATTRIIERAGYRVLQATDATQCVALFDSHEAQVALVLLDGAMPGGGGKHALEHIRQRSQVPVVMISGYDPDGPARSEAAADPHLRFLPKPYDPEELIHLAAALLAQGEESPEPPSRDAP